MLEAVSKKSAEEQKEQIKGILLFRGISKTKEGKIGHWWSTNPYYALGYGEGGKGEIYVVKIGQDQINNHASDVSIEDTFQNYFFQDDPPGARKVTEQEIQELNDNTTFTKLPLGGTVIKTPGNAVEIGQKIFDGQNQS